MPKRKLIRLMSFIICILLFTGLLILKQVSKKYADIKFKVFSDNIIIAKKLSENTVDDVLTILSCVSNFLCAAVGDGVNWLVRGGITLGDFFIDDTIVWGPALVRAYELEDKVANYPRVLLDAPIINLLQSKKQGLEFICIDSDGMAFLNYMTIWYFSGEIVCNAFKNESRSKIAKWHIS